MKFKMDKFKKILIILFIIFLPVIIIMITFIIKYMPLPNTLQEKTHQITVEYTDFLCDCAKWSIVSIDGQPNPNYSHNPDKQGFIYLEEHNSHHRITIPDDGSSRTGLKIKLVGKFYKFNGYPNQSIEGFPDKAPVFHYDYFDIITD